MCAQPHIYVHIPHQHINVCMCIYVYDFKFLLEDHSTDRQEEPRECSLQKSPESNDIFAQLTLLSLEVVTLAGVEVRAGVPAGCGITLLWHNTTVA